MIVTELTTNLSEARNWAMRNAAVLASVIVPSLCLLGCINIKAPDRPIEINLNVNIKQEVVVKLQADAQDLITSNPELFPQ